MLQGQIMDWPLTTASVLQRAGEVYADNLVISQTVEGERVRYGYAEALDRAARLASALRDRLGIRPGERVATLAWSTHRHFEAYYAISGIGAVCHTLNPRYALGQLEYILNHAGDVALLADISFVPLLQALAPKCPTLRHVVIMTDAAHMPADAPPGALCYETLLEQSADDFAWSELDENAAASLCFTSGTTGDPKGGLYSHRACVMHALFTIAGAVEHFLEREKILAIVPLFHVNAWGLPFAAPITGTSLVLPGPHLGGNDLFDLMDEEGVTAVWGVPTIYLGLLAEMQARGRKPPAFERMIVGGAAPPKSLIETFENDYGVDVTHGWGMTEMSPVGALSFLSPEKKRLPAEDRLNLKAKQGRRVYGVDMRIVGEDGDPLPHDGTASGELHVRGVAIINGYYENASATRESFTADGWLKTGDVATIDPNGYMQIVDRSKDMIKSGGEWISSIELENAAMAHPAIAECCVVGVPHPKWQERPLLVVVRREGQAVSGEELRSYLAERVAKIAIPDDVIFVEELPHTATGKVSKREIRETYKDHLQTAD